MVAGGGEMRGSIVEIFTSILIRTVAIECLK